MRQSNYVNSPVSLGLHFDGEYTAFYRRAPDYCEFTRLYLEPRIYKYERPTNSGTAYEILRDID